MKEKEGIHKSTYLHFYIYFTFKILNGTSYINQHKKVKQNQFQITEQQSFG